MPIQPCSINDGFGGNNFVSLRSYHTGGVNTAFVDGHIGFISNSINLQTWQNLAWITDGNVLTDYKNYNFVIYYDILILLFAFNFFLIFITND